VEFYILNVHILYHFQPRLNWCIPWSKITWSNCLFILWLLEKCYFHITIFTNYKCCPFRQIEKSWNRWL